MSDDTFFDNPLHKKTPRPSAAELANLAAALDPAGCRGNPKSALRTAARLWLRATQVCEALDDALNEDDLGTVAWYIAGEDKQPEETWRALERKAAAGELLKLGTDESNSEVLKWLQDSDDVPKSDGNLSFKGFIKAFKKFRPQFDPSIEKEISISELKQFVERRRNNATQGKAERRKKKKVTGLKPKGGKKKASKTSAQPVRTSAKKSPFSRGQENKSRGQTGKK